MIITNPPQKKLKISVCILLGAVFLFFLWEIYVPNSLIPTPESVYVVQKGLGYKEISEDLKKRGIIKNSWFFRFYVLISRDYGALQAGSYNISSSMSVADIVKKLVAGDVIKNNLTIIEGWDLKDIGKYLEEKNLFLKPTSSKNLGEAKQDFLDLTRQDFSNSFDFLKDKPQKLGLEGYIFPDTYEVLNDQTSEEILKKILSNFDKKLTPDLRKEIKSQKKSIFQIITMASLIEKEVITLQDKKIVSGILWKRLASGMPLQIDATINYITNKNDLSVTIEDTKIDSPYNTYKYYGLPLGPICNPGMESILAAIYPEKSDYWYYLSANGTGQTIFSKTLDEHNAAVAKYLK